MVDLMNFFSLTALLHLARHLSAYNIIHASLKDKKNSFVTFICVIGIGMFLTMFIFFPPMNTWSDALFYILFILLEIVITFFTCKGSVFEKIFTGVLIGVANMLSQILGFQLVALMGFPYSYFLSPTIPALPLIIFSSLIFSLSFIYAFIIKLVKNVFFSKKKLITNKSFFFLLIPIINIFYLLSYTLICGTLGDDALNSAAYMKVRSTISIVAAICFVTSVGLLFLVDYIDKIERKNIENEKQILTNTLTYQQTVMLNEEKRELHKIKHDLNNLLSTATGFIEIGKPEKALEILNKTGDSVFGAIKNSICSNEIISTIIYIKQQSASDKNVELNVNVNEEGIVKIAEYDLCRLLHNLIDNSINAAEKSDTDKKSKVKIELGNEFISITTENGFNEETKPKKVDKNHGYGLNIVKEICNRYGGNYSSIINGNRYVAVAKIRNLSY